MLKRVSSQSDPIKAVTPPVKKARALPWIPRAPDQPSKTNIYLQGDVQRDHPGSSSGERTGDARKRREPLEVKIIKMISGGSTDGDSNRARNAWYQRESLVSRSREEGPMISFGPRDLDGVIVPHNDFLVIVLELQIMRFKECLLIRGAL